jgi:DNA-directed RNA polymerase specialized sigma24 family protein
MNAKAQLSGLIDLGAVAEPESSEPAPERPPEAMDTGWRRLLRFLAQGQIDEGVAYERARNRLVRFFAVRGELTADELADATFDRLVAKLTDEVAAEVRSPISYVLRFAHFIHLERVNGHGTRRGRLQALQPEEGNPAEGAYEEHHHTERLELVERCLNNLRPAQRALLVSYYEHDGRARIVWRQQMSRDLGINPTLLRTRVSRLRIAFERRVRALAKQVALA